MIFEKFSGVHAKTLFVIIHYLVLDWKILAVTVKSLKQKKEKKGKCYLASGYQAFILISMVQTISFLLQELIY